VAVEGRYSAYYYTFDLTRGAMPSSLQIVRNCQNAIRKIGGKVLWEDVRQTGWEETTLFVERDGKEFWIHVDPSNGAYNYTVTIIQRESMTQDVIADAIAFKKGLTEAGHVEVPGIYFDTAKADIKPESEAALKEMVKLLKDNANLKVWVVGHTDYTGTLSNNMALSNARAGSVVKALVERGIDGKRLAAFGNGPYAPVTSNHDDAGRSKNRRVELVEQP
jgi:outer membrane protein OmpA-like peptidoglycan-associated protein